MRTKKLVQKSYNREEARILSSLLPTKIVDGKKIITFDNVDVPIIISRVDPNSVGLRRNAKQLDERAEIRDENRDENFDTSLQIKNGYAEIDDGKRIAVSKNERIKASKGCKKVGMQKKIASSYETQIKEARQKHGLNLTLSWEQNNKDRIKKGLEPIEFNTYTANLAQKKRKKQKY